MTLPSQSAGHTPGPWTLQDKGDDEMAYFIIEAGGTNWPDGFHIAGVISEPDARLIARAPDLLAENSKLKGQLEEAAAALAPFAAEYVADDAACHVGICPKEKCGRCSRILAARAAIERAKLKEAGS